MARFVVTPPIPNEVVVTVPGPQGPKGGDGTGIVIKGTLANIAALPATPATVSDAYIIGLDLYVWNGSGWANAGPFRGPKGDQGIPGGQGIPGERGLQGERGFTGNAGIQGNPGPPGNPGNQGLKGDPGNSGAFSQAAAGAPYVQGEGLIYIGVEFPTNFPDGSLFFKKV